MHLLLVFSFKKTKKMSALQTTAPMDCQDASGKNEKMERKSDRLDLTPLQFYEIRITDQSGSTVCLGKAQGNCKSDKKVVFDYGKECHLKPGCTYTVSISGSLSAGSAPAISVSEMSINMPSRFVTTAPKIVEGKSSGGHKVCAEVVWVNAEAVRIASLSYKFPPWAAGPREKKEKQEKKTTQEKKKPTRTTRSRATRN